MEGTELVTFRNAAIFTTEKTIEITSILNVKLSINFCILIPNQSQNPEMPARFMPVDVDITLMAGAMDQHISLIFIE